MLSTKNRLPKKDFQFVYDQGKYYSLDNISLKYTRNNNQQNLRIGVSVGKKSFPKATNRNKLKRLLREALRDYIKNIKPGFDIILFYKPGKEKESYQNLSIQIRRLLEKSGLLIDHDRLKQNK